MITGAQIRAARALLQWSTPVLAKHCGVTAAKLRWAESFNSIPNLDASEIIAIEKALSAGGVEFSDQSGAKAE